MYTYIMHTLHIIRVETCAASSQIVHGHTLEVTTAAIYIQIIQIL